MEKISNSETGAEVLLTGASSGIGLAAAHLLSENGYTVVGTARDPEALRARLQKGPRNSRLPALPRPEPRYHVHLVKMDLTNPASVDKGFAEAQALLGHIDILINNAGQGELGSVEDTDLADSRALFEVNYFSVVRLVKLAIPGMRLRGSGIVLNLGSIVHDLQFPFKAQYCASKSALTGFSLALRYELHPYGVRVVTILEPGWVRSELHNRLRPVVRRQSLRPAARALPRLHPRRPSISGARAVARSSWPPWATRKPPSASP